MVTESVPLRAHRGAVVVDPPIFDDLTGLVDHGEGPFAVSAPSNAELYALALQHRYRAGDSDVRDGA